jgi:hypothetical protein
MFHQYIKSNIFKKESRESTENLRLKWSLLKNYQFFVTVVLAFFKRKRFPLFVPRRYCVQARTFLGAPDRCMNVTWTFVDFPFRPFVIFEGQKSSETVMKRSEMVRDVGRSEKFILYKINGLKRLQNHVHGTFTFTFKKRKN